MSDTKTIQDQLTAKEAELDSIQKTCNTDDFDPASTEGRTLLQNRDKASQDIGRLKLQLESATSREKASDDYQQAFMNQGAKMMERQPGWGKLGKPFVDEKALVEVEALKSELGYRNLVPLEELSEFFRKVEERLLTKYGKSGTGEDAKKDDDANADDKGDDDGAETKNKAKGEDDIDPGDVGKSPGKGDKVMDKAEKDASTILNKRGGGQQWRQYFDNNDADRPPMIGAEEPNGEHYDAFRSGVEGMVTLIGNEPRGHEAGGVAPVNTK
ncbi:MAG: hypothetical protein ACR2PR_06105 [Pseudohongiellaceae bacterium]